MPKLLVSIILVAATGLGILWFFGSQHEVPQVNVEETKSVTPMPANGSQSTDAQINSLEVSNEETTEANIKLAQEMWKMSRGYITEESKYLRRESDEQLESLAEQGNTQALRILANRQLTKDPPKMMGMLEEAVVKGDIPALLTAAGSWSNPYVHNTADSFHVSLSPAVNTLALILTAQLRGDNVLATEQLGQAFADYQFDEQSVQEACGAARTLYEELEGKRLALGYPPFDNTPSPYGRPVESGDYIAATCSREN